MTQTSASGQKVGTDGQSDATRAAAAGGPAATAPKDTTPSKGGTASTATGGAKPKAEKAEGEGRGRKSQYSGMRLKATVDANPRREGSHGHKSLAILLAAGKDGILYEDYIKKGGRLNDLVWDINKDHVVAVKA